MPAKKKLPYCYEYPRPAATADALVWSFGERGWRVLLIERRSEPFAGRWALPGGFVNPDEPPLAACIRELKEETNVAQASFRDVGVFGEKGRDPRGWTISYAFYTLVHEGQVRARAGDDASRSHWHSMDALPDLAFDHAKIIAAARRRLVSDLYTTPIARPLLTESFSAAMVDKLFRVFDPDLPKGAPLARLESFGVVKRAGRQWRFVDSPAT